MTRLVRRRALLIGNEHYDDGRFPPLPSTQADTWGMEQVLQHRNIGGFVSVTSRDNLAADDMREVISDFLEACEQDELALVYMSGHGARLVRDGGEFYFIATDTDFDRIAETAVSAGFVNEQLEQCWASQKVMMIDCCRSGGFAVGLRTSDRQSESVAKSAEQPLLTSRGTYVLSSSRAGEDSYADVASTAEVRPSDFTAEVIEALRTGKVSKDGKGDVSVENLFHYVNRRMRAQRARQVPVKSAFGVDDRIVLADCPLGAAPLLVPLTRRPVSSPPHDHGPGHLRLSGRQTLALLIDRAKIPAGAVPFVLTAFGLGALGGTTTGGRLGENRPVGLAPPDVVLYSVLPVLRNPDRSAAGGGRRRRRTGAPPVPARAGVPDGMARRVGHARCRHRLPPQTLRP